MIERESQLPKIEVVEPEMARVLAEKSESDRLKIGWAMWRSARKMLWRVVQAEQADWSDSQIQEEVNRRLSHKR